TALRRPMGAMQRWIARPAACCYAVAQTTYGFVVMSPMNASDVTRTCQPSPATVGAEPLNRARNSPPEGDSFDAPPPSGFLPDGHKTFSAALLPGLTVNGVPATIS